MKNYYESLKEITSQACRGLQKLIGYEPLHPKEAILHVIDRRIESEEVRIVSPDEFAESMSKLYSIGKNKKQ